jgi:dihydroneopterin aldolase
LSGVADRIFLRGLSFFGFHGVHEQEKTLGQRFVVDLALELELAPAGRADDLALSVSYSEAYRVVRARLEGPSMNTLEAVAESVAADLFSHFPLVQAVHLRLHKPAAPIQGAQFRSVGVEIHRTRAAAQHG